MSQFDDERERARAAILKRRATLVVYAVAAGISMPACGGKAQGDDGGAGGSAMTGGTKNGGGNGSTAGFVGCLQPPFGGYGGYGATGGSVCLSVCLGMPYGGDTYCLSGGGPPIEGGGGPGGAGGEAGAPLGGMPPILCLSAPLAGAPSTDGGGGDDGASGGAEP